MNNKCKPGQNNLTLSFISKRVFSLSLSYNTSCWFPLQIIFPFFYQHRTKDHFLVFTGFMINWSSESKRLRHSEWKASLRKRLKEIINKTGFVCFLSFHFFSLFDSSLDYALFACSFSQLPMLVGLRCSREMRSEIRFTSTFAAISRASCSVKVFSWILRRRRRRRNSNEVVNYNYKQIDWQNLQKSLASLWMRCWEKMFIIFARLVRIHRNCNSCQLIKEDSFTVRTLI